MSEILYVDDDPEFQLVVQSVLQSDFGVTTASSGPEALKLLTEHSYHFLITDLLMPGMDGLEVTKQARALNSEIPIIILSNADSVDRAIQALNLGAVDYLIKSGTAEQLNNTLRRAIHRVHMERENKLLKEQLAPRHSAHPKSTSADMKKLLEQARLVAQSDSTVLITGENGTGKEVLANFIHHNSGRADKQMIIVNCAALSEQLLASELFGHVKGAFTGAYKNHQGYFEIADACTIFLDEIAEISLNMQVKLLRVLQDKQFQRVGETKSQSTNVRIIAASNRDLAKEIEAGNFREDLYFRLNVFEFKIPPLRQRLGDIIPLFTAFIAEFSSASGRPAPLIPDEVASRLRSYSWPGNIRELRNLAERTVILAGTSGRVTMEMLPDKMSESTDTEALLEIDDYSKARKQQARDFDIRYITYKLKKHRGNIAATARTIGIHPVNLRQKIAKLGIDTAAIKALFR